MRILGTVTRAKFREQRAVEHVKSGHQVNHTRPIAVYHTISNVMILIITTAGILTWKKPSGVTQLTRMFAGSTVMFRFVIKVIQFGLFCKFMQFSITFTIITFRLSNHGRLLAGSRL